MISGGRAFSLDDTIVARSSSAGPGLRAVVRLGGPHAFRALAAILPDFEPDPIARRQVFAGDLWLAGLVSPLPAEVFVLRAPHTYTGQDLAEIHVWSSPPLVELLLRDLLAAGARAALPGEFTMRGFLAGKLDLTRAEAVHAVVEADNDVVLARSLAQLAGGVADPLRAVRDDLLDLLADVEAGLDFADEDIEFVRIDAILARIAKALAHVTLLGRSLADRAVRREALRVVLAGPPNAGKSSLFNALVGRDAALVAPEAGTTRDYLEADWRLPTGDVVRLVDTAGLGPSLGPIDASAQTLGQTQTAAADLILWCQAPDTSPAAAPPGAVVVATKRDLAPLVETPTLAVSVRTGAGLADLASLTASRLADATRDPLAESLARCRGHIDAALEHLRLAHASALHHEPPELLALYLRLSLDSLASIAGAVHPDDLLDRIFTKFCIGK